MIKLYRILLSFILTCMGCAVAIADQASTNGIETSFKASKGHNWVFEFKNKDKEPLVLTLVIQMNIQWQGLRDNKHPSIKEAFDKVIADEVEVPASKGSKESEHGYVRMDYDFLQFPKLGDDDTLTNWPGKFRGSLSLNFNDEGYRLGGYRIDGYLLIRNKKNSWAKAWKLSNINYAPRETYPRESIRNTTTILTYEKDKLRPQGGKLFGSSQSGIDLIYNIQPSFIKVIEPDIVIDMMKKIQ